MTTLKKRIAVLFVAAVVIFPIPGQPAQQQQAPNTAPLPADAASKEQLKKLFEVIGVQKQMQSILTSMTSSMQQMMPSAGELSEKQKDGMSKLQAELFGKILSPQFIDSYLDMMVPAYQRHFTKSEVDQIIAFYSSPAGQKFVNEQPALLQEIFPKVLPMIQQHMQEVMKEMNYEDRLKAVLSESEKPEGKPK